MQKQYSNLATMIFSQLALPSEKQGYIKDFAQKVYSGVFDLNIIEKMDDNVAIKELTKLKGIGVWTAEMILLFCLERPDIFSYDDLAIRRGLCMLYHHKVQMLSYLKDIVSAFILITVLLASIYGKLQMAQFRLNDRRSSENDIPSTL